MTNKDWDSIAGQILPQVRTKGRGEESVDKHETRSKSKAVVLYDKHHSDEENNIRDLMHYQPHSKDYAGSKSKALVLHNKRQSDGTNKVRDLTQYHSHSKDHGSSRQESASTSKCPTSARQKWTDDVSSHRYNDKQGDRASRSKSNHVAQTRQSQSDSKAVVPFDKSGSTKALSKYVYEDDEPARQERSHNHRSSHRFPSRSPSPSRSLRHHAYGDTQTPQDNVQLELLKSVKELQDQVKDMKLEMSNSQKALTKPSSSSTHQNSNTVSSRHRDPDAPSHRPKHSSRANDMTGMDEQLHPPFYTAPTAPTVPTQNNVINIINLNVNSHNTNHDLDRPRYKCRTCEYM